MKALCIFNRLLGNKAYSDRLSGVLQGMDGLDLTYLYFDQDDYSKDYGVPKIYSMSATFEGGMILRYKYKQELKLLLDECEVVIFLTFWMPLVFPLLIKKKRVILALDGTPKQAHELLGNVQKTWREKTRSFVVEKIISFVYRKVIFANVDAFLPLTDWCAGSLKRDYGVHEDKIFTSYYSIKLDEWKPGEHRCRNKLRLLFVGNDFRRKGGLFLIRLYSEHLKKEFELVIVSNDSIFDTLVLPSGITLIKGLSSENQKDLISVYKESDVFVFPTYRDQLGLVLIEAMAAGLVVIARDVGGIKDIVIDDYNGYLMNYESCEKEWADKLIALSKNKKNIFEMKNNSRSKAIEKFSGDKFDAVVNSVVNHVLNVT